MLMIADDGCFEEVSAVIDMCPFVVFHVLHVEALKLIVYLLVYLCYGIKGLLLVHCFLVRK